MKRAFLSIIILMMGLAQSEAKIQRTFLGVSLGIYAWIAQGFLGKKTAS